MTIRNLVFDLPECPYCGLTVGYDADFFECPACGITWDPGGNFSGGTPPE